MKSMAREDARYVREEAEARTGVPATAPGQAGSVHVDEREAAKFIGRYDNRSHGESFMDLFSQRVRPGGLYLLDEPEAPLSPRRQVAFLELLATAAAKGSQFIIATHSPILLGCPGARLYSFDRDPVAEVAYEELEHVTVTREFLLDPARFLALRPR
jgi:predicted ATPase